MLVEVLDFVLGCESYLRKHLSLSRLFACKVVAQIFPRSQPMRESKTSTPKCYGKIRSLVFPSHFRSTHNFQ
jgi:hypothetical protein